MLAKEDRPNEKYAEIEKMRIGDKADMHKIWED